MPQPAIDAAKDADPNRRRRDRKRFSGNLHPGSRP
jgi:hypothetical protein